MKVQWWCYSSRRIITLYWRTIGPFRCWVMYINWFSGSLQIVSNEGSMTSSHPGKPGSEKVTILWTYILWQVINAFGLWESLWFRQNLGGAWISPTITNWLSAYRSAKLFVWKSHYVSPSTWIVSSSKAIPLKRGVRKGDVMSSKLLTAALEDAFKLLEWTGLGININGEYIIQLRFADDIVAR